MLILNLVDETKSHIKYKINRFPDGQQDVVIDPVIETAHCSTVISAKPVEIKSRMNNFRDVELILCATAALRNLGVKEIHLFAPYILGARSDRKFVNGGTRYLSEIIAPIINAQNFESVKVLDPHSDVMENVIHRLIRVDNVELVRWATRDIFGPIEEHGPNSKYPFIMVSPDAGALKKIYNVAEGIGFDGKIVIASKHRDIATGKILSTEVPVTPSPAIGFPDDYLIVDDICDGGKTFIEIAKVINEKYSQMGVIRVPKIYLVITHGIFSAGFNELATQFEAIYCTNSVYTVSDEEWMNTNKKRFIRQRNIF